VNGGMWGGGTVVKLMEWWGEGVRFEIEVDDFWSAGWRGMGWAVYWTERRGARQVDDLRARRIS
jgi:hypothetical protein